MRLNVYVWYVSNTLTYRQLSNLFGIAKSTAWRIVRYVASWLLSIGEEYIRWPNNTDAAIIQAKFLEKSRIPGVFGALDCTHISIIAPRVDKECYFDRNLGYSIVLQAVVDADKKFLNVFCGEPGSLHDSRVLRRSELYRTAESNYHEMFPNNSFLLGDSAYFPTTWLVPPFKDYGNLSEAQRKFNKVHSKARIVIENGFGLLKTRFRRLLHFTEHVHLSFVSDLLISICILHNICCLENDHITNYTLQYNFGPEDEEADFGEEPERRQRLLNLLQNLNVI